MLYQYHCACCDKVVESNVKECSECGSHNIKSPYGFWILCIITCLAAAIIFKVVHIYMNQQQIPQQPSLWDSLKQKDKSH